MLLGWITKPLGEIKMPLGWITKPLGEIRMSLGLANNTLIFNNVILIYGINIFYYSMIL